MVETDRSFDLYNIRSDSIRINNPSGQFSSSIYDKAQIRWNTATKIIGIVIEIYIL